MFYQFDFDTNNYANFIPQNISYDLMHQFDGRHHAESWTGIHYIITDNKDKRPIPDFISGSIPACSKKAYDKIYDMCKNYAEFLPCSVGQENAKYYVLNIIHIESCIDYNNSKIVRYSNGDIMLFNHIEFKKNINPTIFRINDLAIGHFFANDSFVRIVKESGLTGLNFKNDLFL